MKDVLQIDLLRFVKVKGWFQQEKNTNSLLASILIVDNRHQLNIKDTLALEFAERKSDLVVYMYVLCVQYGSLYS